MGSNKLTKKSKKEVSKFKGLECLNCGAPLELTDNFCPNCSQRNSTKQLSMNDFFEEFFSSLFTYDSRLRYTVKDLLFKPGTITKNYVSGQRLKYANPFRFFLSVSIIYFIIQSFSTGDNSNFSVDGNAIKNDSLTEVLKKATTQNNIYFNTDSLNQEIDSIITINNLANEKKEGSNNPTYYTEKELDTMNWFGRMAERTSVYRNFYNKTKIKNPEIALDSLKHPKTDVNKWIYNKNNAIDRVIENPNGFINYLMGKIPFFLFFFAPFFAFFFWILYSMKKYNYMEHLILIFHIFSFVFLISLLVYIPDLILGDNGILQGIVLMIIGPFYFYKALRNFYKQKRLLTIFKFILLNTVFFIGSSIAALIFFTITAAIY